MACRVSQCVLLVAVLVTVASFSVSHINGFIIPPASKHVTAKRSESSLGQAQHRLLEGMQKRGDIQPRQKRYTGYQDRASSFCTGMCMFEESKSYSECFDMCNWYMY